MQLVDLDIKLGVPQTISSRECPVLLQFVLEMGTAQDGAWARCVGPHKAFWMLLQANPNPYHSGMFPVPTEAWVLSKLKQLDGPWAWKWPPEDELTRNPSSSSPACSCGFGMGSAPLHPHPWNKRQGQLAASKKV